jgi:recombination protein RecT
MTKSSIATLRENTGVAPQNNTPMTVPEMLNRYKSEIARALPKHITADRMTRIALTAFRQNPALMQCDPRSVFAAIVISAQLGLEIGQLGHAYLVPYKKECQFIPGWKGLVDLVNRAGRASVWTGAVYEGDEFQFQLGTEPRIHHVPSGKDEKLTHVYAIGKVRNAELPIIEVWPTAKVEKHRNRYNKVGGSHYSYKHFEAYARKVALLQVIKYMPASVELSQAYDLDMAAENANQKLSLDDVQDGYLLPPTEEEAPLEPKLAEAVGILGITSTEASAMLTSFDGDQAKMLIHVNQRIDGMNERAI